MVGKGAHAILGVRSVDPVLSLVAPIGLAASVGTGLVVDLGPARPEPGARTLRDLNSEGPSLAEMSPGRTGVAFLAGGGISAVDAAEIIERLAGRWPVVSVRVVDSSDWPFPVVPVVPLYPGRLLASHEPRGVWQPVGNGATPPGPGPVLPRLRPAITRRLLAGQLPRRSRWVGAWRQVWEMPWA
ncbi:MAG: hypothetical protein WAL25_03865 [Acidimicrobiia bacterium]